MLQSEADDVIDAAGQVTHLLSGIGDFTFSVSRLFREQAPEYIDYGVALITGMMVFVIVFTLM